MSEKRMISYETEFFNLLRRDSTAREQVVLVEGSRNLFTRDRPRLVEFAKELARLLPQAMFRTGNAPGADEAFAEGVRTVDPSRLQYVLPYETHGKKKIDPHSQVYPLDAIPDSELKEACQQAMEATPEIAGLIRLYMKLRVKNRSTVKALYLIRDALKVLGSRALSLAPATAGIFYVDPRKPDSGGTGHTIRLCRLSNVPVWNQTRWMK
ncbi:MAG: hypothetical protein JRH08_11730 [Deltaproteobacteria bacterium]|nr:hypothetical protein [Deltaproteobacteria bacterium]MBW1930388.1 hypothetical protein [Deltaproteobacteria bacterium]MBW2024009.1 hypothetical protein [Deltaproteobacteria bacterium]MBW2126342.1 hypothetical protein [Deltaproteobacteria bacterium]